MSIFRRIFRLVPLCFILAALLLQSCSSSRNANSAKDDPTVFVAPNYVKKDYKKILILARAQDADKEKLVEDAVVKEFKGNNYKAFPAYSIVTPELLKDTLALRAKLESEGFDAAVSLTWLGKTNKTIDQYRYSGTMYSVFYGAAGVFDLETQTVSTGYAQIDFFIAGVRGTQYRAGLPIALSSKRSVIIEQLAIATRKKLVQDGIL
jgi:hypothetical protein